MPKKRAAPSTGDDRAQETRVAPNWAMNTSIQQHFAWLLNKDLPGGSEPTAPTPTPELDHPVLDLEDIIGPEPIALSQQQGTHPQQQSVAHNHGTAGPSTAAQLQQPLDERLWTHSVAERAGERALSAATSLPQNGDPDSPRSGGSSPDTLPAPDADASESAGDLALPAPPRPRPGQAFDLGLDSSKPEPSKAAARVARRPTSSGSNTGLSWHSIDPSISGAAAVYPKPKRSEPSRRSTVTSTQAAVLLQFFEREPFPETSAREQLAAQLGLQARTVQVWFQNRRQRQRRRK